MKASTTALLVAQTLLATTFAAVIARVPEDANGASAHRIRMEDPLSYYSARDSGRAARRNDLPPYHPAHDK